MVKGRVADLGIGTARSGYLDLHNFRARAWKPAQLAARDRADAANVRPATNVRDLRPAGGIFTFDLSRFMGAPSRFAGFS